MGRLSGARFEVPEAKGCDKCEASERLVLCAFDPWTVGSDGIKVFGEDAVEVANERSSRVPPLQQRSPFYSSC